MRALLLHISGDVLGNLSVIVSGLVIWLTDVRWRSQMDPVASIVIALIIFATTVPFGQYAHYGYIVGAKY